MESSDIGEESPASSNETPQSGLYTISHNEKPLNYLSCIAGVLLGIIILSFSPYTYYLDQLKELELRLFGNVLLIVAPGYALIRQYRFFRRERKFAYSLPPILGFVFIIFVLWQLISGLFSQYRWVSYITLINFVACIGFFAAIYFGINTWRQFYAVLSVIAFFVLLTILFGWLHYLGVFRLWNKYLPVPHPSSTQMGFCKVLISTLANTSGTMFSTILGVRYYAIFLILVAPLIFILLIRRLSSDIRYYYYVLLGLLFITLLATRQYFEVLIFCVASVVGTAIFWRMAKVNGGSPAPFTRRLAIDILLVILVIFVLGTVLGFLYGFREEYNLGTAGLWTIWRPVPELIMLNPLWGNGAGSFRILYNAYRPPDYLLYNIKNITLSAFNCYLNVAVESGLIGLFLFLSLCFLTFFFLWKNAKKVSEINHKIALVALLTTLLTLMLAMLIMPVVRRPILHVLMWSFWGLFFAVIKLTSRTCFKSPSPLTFNLASGVICMVLISISIGLCLNVLPYSVKSFIGAYWHNRMLIYASRNQHNRATEVGRKALRFDPFSATTYYKLGHYLSSGDKIKKSLKVYKDLERLWPHYAELDYNFATLYYRLYLHAKAEDKRKEAEEYLAQAVKYIHQARQLGKRPTILLTYAEILTAEGKGDKAKAKILQLLADSQFWSQYEAVWGEKQTKKLRQQLLDWLNPTESPDD
ncbi:O-antigen ligase family protein [Candidatus Sumerlaeota bacterium]|nr:O-antigen ligase family protein [Candidatus Sumerlaeota bacterium]